MSGEQLHSDLVEFASSLMRLEAILSQNEQQFWAEKIAHARLLAEKSDGFSVDFFLSLLGGMGSLNDVLIPDASPSVNAGIRSAISRAYSLAQAFKKQM